MSKTVSMFWIIKIKNIYLDDVLKLLSFIENWTTESDWLNYNWL